MLDTKIAKAINGQINHELRAWYAYLAMAGYFDQQNLRGFSAWMEAQSAEEQQHARRLIRYLLDRGGQLELEPIEQPTKQFSSTRQVFETALELERDNTQAIHNLYVLAKDLNDFPTLSHLQWFLDEQVEEEKTMEDVLGRLDIAGDDKSALLMLDDQMGRRSGLNEANSE